MYLVIICLRGKFGINLPSSLLLQKIQKYLQKQPSRGVLKKKCSENIQQIYRRTPMPKCGFNKVALTLRHGCSPVNLLHIFRTPFPRNTYGRLLLYLPRIHNSFITNKLSLLLEALSNCDNFTVITILYNNNNVLTWD